MQHHDTLIIIPARMASMRLPNKPMADINGKPMIVHVWERAVAAKIGEVLVACDSQQVVDAISAVEGKAMLTRDDHPSGSDRIWEAYTHFDPEARFSTIINVQGDLPTLDPALVHNVMEPLHNPAVDIATLACVISQEDEKQDPAVVKPIISFAQSESNAGHIGQALYFTRCSAPYGAGDLHHHIGIYAYRRDSLRRFVGLAPSPLEQREKLEQLRALENGMRIDVAIVNTVPLGVDTPQHLEKARKALA
ncbi:MAG: 3-deoxy-manno-octulosonate cytidylyltransferase [Alphaproteobacteria bacterium]|nr:3-deoxy-manno-octulosonate cytidylyltransferase [Alphaproteobacteria bacterium]